MNEQSRAIDSERLYKALQAQLRQDFVAPAASIAGFAEILLEETERLKLAYRTDLERIKSAGENLQLLLNFVLAQKNLPEDLDGYRTKLRHDLRTPINAVKGYAEMILEDASAEGHQSLLQDLEKLLAASGGLLGKIDALVAFTDQSTFKSSHSYENATRIIESFRFAAPLREKKSMAGRILVVDDNAMNRDLLSRQLARGGHAVEGAASGPEAFSLLEKQDFDLILLDVLMPEMSGFEVLVRLKQNPKSSDIPVIMVSALDELDSIVRCIDGGAIDYLPKPFEPTLLRARIRASLENKFLHDREREMMEEIRKAKVQNEALLLSILPRPVVDRIHGGAVMVADDISETTILFADLVEFTPFAQKLPPSEVVAFLNRVFSVFDRLAEKHGAEKIKTIGDAYMVAVGIPEPVDDHAESCARLALAMLAALDELKAETNAPIRLRIGLHTGPAIAGVIGEKKFAYDIWGATVNIASRMESHGAPGRIHVSKVTADRLGKKFNLSPRGAIEVKGAGMMETFFLESERG